MGNITVAASTIPPLQDHTWFEDALVFYEKHLLSHPNDPLAFQNRGYAMLNLGRYKESIYWSEQALAVNPDLEIALNNKAFAMAEMGRYEEALGVYTDLVQRFGDSARLWNNKGMLYQVLGDHKNAHSCFERALAASANKRFQSSHINRAGCLVETANFDEALELYTELLTSPDTEPYALMGLATIKVRKNQYSEAVSLLDRVLVKDPDNGAALAQKAYALYKIGHPELGVGYLDRMLQLIEKRRAKECIPYLLAHAQVAFRKEQYEEALDWYEAVLSKNPRCPDALYGKGLVLQLRDDLLGAIIHFNQCLAVNLNYRDRYSFERLDALVAVLEPQLSRELSVNT